MQRKIEKLRVEYGGTPLCEEALSQDPIEQFSTWFNQAIDSHIFEPNAMTLSTVTFTGRCSSRTVLLKQFDKTGFVFFSSSISRKGEHLRNNNHVALCFWWREIFRQVLIEGSVQKLSREKSAAYFKRRPRGAQIAAIASKQSEVLSSRGELEKRYADLKKKYAGQTIPCPKDFTGYRVVPDRMEFWQGKKNRLHDRFIYVKGDGKWLITALFP